MHSPEFSAVKGAIGISEMRHQVTKVIDPNTEPAIPKIVTSGESSGARFAIDVLNSLSLDRTQRKSHQIFLCASASQRFPTVLF